MNAPQAIVSRNADSEERSFHSFHSNRCIFNLGSAVRRTAPEFQGKIWMAVHLRCVDFLLCDNSGKDFFEFFLPWQFTMNCRKSILRFLMSAALWKRTLRRTILGSGAKCESGRCETTEPGLVLQCVSCGLCTLLPYE